MTAEDIRTFIAESLQAQLQNARLDNAALTGDFDLLGSGLIDSMSFLNLVVEIEDWLGAELNLEDLDPEQLTKVGPLCSFVEAQLADA